MCGNSAIVSCTNFFLYCTLMDKFMECLRRLLMHFRLYMYVYFSVLPSVLLVFNSL